MVPLLCPSSQNQHRGSGALKQGHHCCLPGTSLHLAALPREAQRVLNGSSLLLLVTFYSKNQVGNANTEEDRLWSFQGCQEPPWCHSSLLSQGGAALLSTIPGSTAKTRAPQRCRHTGNIRAIYTEDSTAGSLLGLPQPETKLLFCCIKYLSNSNAYLLIQWKKGDLILIGMRAHNRNILY